MPCPTPRHLNLSRSLNVFKTNLKRPLLTTLQDRELSHVPRRGPEQSACAFRCSGCVEPFNTRLHPGVSCVALTTRAEGFLKVTTGLETRFPVLIQIEACLCWNG